VKEAKGWIDPCPFWDDDGQAFLVHAFANSRAGIKSVLDICRMSPDGTRLLDEGTRVFDGREHHPTIEGPKMYKRNGNYYIFAPAGGVTPGWQTVLRSTNVFGPYEDKIVLAQGDTEINGPHQGGWVELESGEHWFVHFQDRGAYGRITHLQPVRWINDWPVMGIDKDGNGTGEPVLTYKKPNVGRTWPIAVPATTDEFDSTTRALQWQWHANFKADWSSLTGRPGWLRLFAQPRPDGAANLWPVPNLLLQKLPAPGFTVTTRLDATALAEGARTGLVMFGMDYAYLSVERTSGGLQVRRVTCKDARGGKGEIEEAAVPLSGEEVILRVSVRPEAVCSFSYSTDGEKFTPIGNEFTAVEGRWIGAKVGLFCLQSTGAGTGGYADFDWFRFE
jgi:beta-xylosidase